MGLTRTIITQYLKQHIKSIFRYMEHPHDVQGKWLKQLLRKAENTAWGKQYDYRSIQTLRAFQERVPLSSYDELKPYIQQMMRGEKDILWPGTTRWFSKSSGTTSDKSKFIPVSNENLDNCHLRGPRDTMALWHNSRPGSKIFNGYGLVMGGSHYRYGEHPATHIGDISAIMLQRMPWYAKYVHSPSIKVALMSEWEEKIERMAHEVIKRNMTSMSGVPTWTIVLFRRILEITGKKNLLEVFPNLELYIHGGVSFAPYEKQFREFLPSRDMGYWEVYNSSEGYFGTRCQEDDDDMLLLLNNGIFYEFIPMSVFGTERQYAISLEEVQTGENYALVISSNSGLWRYIVGDTVTFTSTQPYKIQITGRTKHFINAFGEEVMVSNTDAAIARTCRAFDVEIREYTVAPIYLSHEGKGGHEWAVEFSKRPDNMAAFVEALDHNLQQVNSDYEAKRYRDMALECLRLREVPPNTFHNWLKSRGKYGGQHKVPRLSNNREILEQILAFANPKSFS